MSTKYQATYLQTRKVKKNYCYPKNNQVVVIKWWMVDPFEKIINCK
jgi:hypothetical protein